MTPPAPAQRREALAVEPSGAADPPLWVVARRRQLFTVAGLHAEAADPSDEAVARRRRRLEVQVVGEWLALLVLLLVPTLQGDATAGALVLDGSERAVFSVGILVVAVHSGMRLAELLAVRRLLRELATLPLAEPTDSADGEV